MPSRVRAVTDPETNPVSSLLSSFALGPAWARAAGSGPQQAAPKRETRHDDERPPRRGDRDDDRRGSRGRDDRGGGSRFRGRGRDDDRRNGPPRHEEAPPAEGVRVTLVPDAQAVHLIGKEVHQVARVYPLFDVAKILLAERGRCRAVFEAPEPHAPLYRGKLDESVFLTREEAARHLWSSELKKQFVEEEVIEVDPPTGNFQLVAKCGLTGMWLGPPNFHAYQVNLRRLHRECFPNMPFAAYSAKVRTERGEEAVNAWLETMKKRIRWRIKGDGDDAWIDDRSEAERALSTRCFDQAFAETRRAEVLASVPPQNLSASLMTSLKIAGNHARNHPAILIPAVCKAVEAEHLPVFKRQGKLFTGPARPHPLPPGQALAERPAIMVDWIRNNKPAKLEGLWKAVLPEGSTAPPAEFAADLFWLLHQGHILLFTDDTLVVQEVREPTPPADPSGEGKVRKKKKKKKKSEAPGESPTADAEQPGDDAGEDSDSPGDDADQEAESVAASESAEPEPEAPVEALEPAFEADLSGTPAAHETETATEPAPGESALETPVEPAATADEAPAATAAESGADAPPPDESSPKPSTGVDEPSAL